MKTIPTAEQLNPFDDLDGRAAVRRFLGKTMVEAEALFRENSMLYQEDLMWMGPEAFKYYFPAAVSYIQSEASQGDEDMVRCLASVIDFRLDGDRESVDAVSEEVIALSDAVLGNPEKFHDAVPVSEDVLAQYRGFHERYS